MRKSSRKFDNTQIAIFILLAIPFVTNLFSAPFEGFIAALFSRLYLIMIIFAIEHSHINNNENKYYDHPSAVKIIVLKIMTGFLVMLLDRLMLNALGIAPQSQTYSFVTFFSPLMVLSAVLLDWYYKWRGHYALLSIFQILVHRLGRR